MNRTYICNQHKWCGFLPCPDCGAMLTESPPDPRDAEIAALKRQLADARGQYDELLYAVGRKYSGETRHQTALRYIRQAEAGNTLAGEAKGATE